MNIILYLILFLIVLATIKLFRTLSIYKDNVDRLYKTEGNKK